MQTISKSCIALLAILALSASYSRAEAPLRADINVAVASRHVSDVNGNPPTSPDTLLYGNRPCDPANPTVLNPVTAPDGHQITWGEWTQIEGQAAVKCINNGSHVVVHLSGLIPNGQYTVWVFIFHPAGNLVAAGPLGAQDGSENGFVADADGVGHIGRVLPPGMLSAKPGPFDGCLTDEDEFQVHVVYHIDGMTHGNVPGPGCTWALQGLFDFTP
jgi:hypothetical protein